LLESDDHITIRLPPLIMDKSLQMFGECGCGQVSVGAYLLIVSLTEGNYVVVRRQNLATADRAGTGLRLAAQHRLYFLWDDRAAEDSGERVTHRGLELAFDAVDQTHITARLRLSSFVVRAGSPSHRVSLWPHCSHEWYRPCVVVRDQQNSENQIAAGQ
jgi:hypothetical protein